MPLRRFTCRKILAGLAAVACLGVVLFFVERSLRRPGRDIETVEFKRVLLEQISKADKITVAEHASPLDGPEGADPTHDYRAVDLDAGQVARLKEMVAGTPEMANEWVMGCFIPHHAIRFSRDGVQTGELKVCLECSGLRISQFPSIAEPAGLFPKVSDFLAELGFERASDEEWNRRSVEWLEKNGAGVKEE